MLTFHGKISKWLNNKRLAFSNTNQTFKDDSRLAIIPVVDDAIDDNLHRNQKRDYINTGNGRIVTALYLMAGKGCIK